VKKHPIFPVELYIFENADLIDPTLDALDPIERGMFNMPNNVQTTAGNLHLLDTFKPITNWIETCLEEIKKDQQFEMYGKFEISLMWGVVSPPDSGGCHNTHRHPMSYWSGLYCMSYGSPTLFQDPVIPRAYNQMEIVSSVYENAMPAPTYKPGTLIVWPSWLLHFTTPHLGDFPRIGLSFNAMPTGAINQGPFGQNMVNLQLLKDDNTDRSKMWEYDEKGYGKDGLGK
tara:strand:- start:5812 stop:6498 length:687 start_codon:yes stop_codon:yes gene_type:complete